MNTRNKPIRIIDTLTEEEILDIFNGNLNEIFTAICREGTVLYPYRQDLCRGYYLFHSAERLVSPAYERYSKLWEVSKFFTANIGYYIHMKFIDKWQRVHSALLESEYNPLKNKDSTVTKTATNQDKITYDSEESKNGNNTDTTTYDTSVVNDGRTGSKETITRSSNENSDVYGFNSAEPVGDSVLTEEYNETATSLPADNTTHNTEDKSGTDTKVFDIDETVFKTGADTRDITVDETTIKTERDESGAELIEKELLVRNKYIFFDIVFKDIDSVMTLSIY